jgi:hypothetical protein
MTRVYYLNAVAQRAYYSILRLFAIRMIPREHLLTSCCLSSSSCAVSDLTLCSAATALRCSSARARWMACRDSRCEPR